VLLGELLLRSGMADRMYQAFAAWFGRLTGGLLNTNIGCCALFAATSGSSVATAATIGTVALPSLRRHGYNMPDALGSLTALCACPMAALGSSNSRQQAARCPRCN
jgi:TRAP-type C4-dicarboxylate transport system permease large subunit